MVIMLKIILMLLCYVTECFSICGVGQFLDKDSGMCDYCTVVCEFPLIQGTLQKCTDNCPGYLTRPPIPTMEIFTISKGTTSTPQLLSTSFGTAVTAASITGLVLVIVAAVLYREKIRQMIQSVGNRCKPRYPVQVEDRSENVRDGGSEKLRDITPLTKPCMDKQKCRLLTENIH